MVPVPEKKKKIFYVSHPIKKKILVIPFGRIGFFLIRSHLNFGSRTSQNFFHLFRFQPINLRNYRKLAANKTASDLDDNITKKKNYMISQILAYNKNGTFIFF